MKLLAFAGSNSSRSINHKLLEALLKEVEIESELISLRDYPAPLFGIDIKEAEGVPATIRNLHAKMLEADALLVSVAEHNGSMTAALKNTFDWLSMLEKKFFLNKPTVFLSTSPGSRGAASALQHIVEIMPYRGANIVGSHSLGSFEDHYNNGTLSSEALDAFLPIMRNLKQSIETTKI